MKTSILAVTHFPPVRLKKRLSLIACLLFFPGVSQLGWGETTFTWQRDTNNGNWIYTSADFTRWTNNEGLPAGSFPNAPGQIVLLNTVVGGDRQINVRNDATSVGGEITFGSLHATSSNAFLRTIQRNSGVGASSLIFDSGDGSSSFLSLDGAGSGGLTFVNNNAGLTLQLNNQLVITNSNTDGGVITLGTPITGVGGIQKTGGGMVTLSSDSSTFTGEVSVNQGLLTISHERALGDASAISVSETGQLRVDMGGNLTLGEGAGTVINLAGDGDGNGSLRISSSVIDANRSLANSIHLSGNTTLGIQGGGNALNLLGNLTGTGVLTRSGANSGVFTLTGTNDATIGLNLLNGTFVLAGTPTERTFASLAGTSGTTFNLGSTATTISGGQATEFSGVVSGVGGSLVVTNGTDLQLNGNNTFTGGVTVDGASVRVGSNTAFGTGSLSVGAGGATFTSLDGNRSIGNAVSIGGDILFTGDNRLTISGITTLAPGNHVLDVQNTSERLQFQGDIMGPGGLIKNGPGEVRFTGDAKTYTGATVVNAGRLQISEPGQMNATSSVALNGGELYLASAGDRNYTLGQGSVVLNGGTLRQEADGALADVATLTNNIVVQSNSRIDARGESTLNLGGNITGAGVLQKGAGGVLNINGTNASSIGFNITNGTLNLNSHDRTLASLASSSGTTINFGGNTLTIDQAADTEVSGVLDGFGAFTKTGTGELRLDSTANTLSGPVTIDGGTLAIREGGALGTANAITVKPDGTLRLRMANSAVGDVTYNLPSEITLAGGTLERGGGNEDFTAFLTNNVNLTADSSIGSTGGRLFTITGDITGENRLITKTGSGTVSVTGSLPTAFGLDIRSGTFDFNNGEDIVLSQLSGSSGSNLSVTSSNIELRLNQDLEFNGSIAGTGSFSKTGSGELRIDGTSSTFTGSWTIHQGTLAVREGGSLGKPTSVVIDPDGTLRLRMANSATGDVIYDFGPNPITLAGGTLERGGGNENFTAILTNNINVTADSTLGSTGGRLFQIDGNLIGGNHILSKRGSGTLVLNGTNSPTLGFDVRNGTLDFGNQTRMVSFFAVDDDASVVIQQQLTVNQTANTSVQGLLSGAGGITKSGSGALAFTQQNKTYTGPTIIDGGTLRMSGSGQATDTASVTIDSGGILELSSAANYRIGPGPVILDGGRLFSSREDSGDVVALENSLQVRSDSIIDVAGDSILFADGALSGSGNVNKQGTGFLVLRGDRSGFSGSFVGQNAIIPIRVEIPRGEFYQLNSPDGNVREFNDLMGQGGISKRGPARTTLYGRNNFTGPIRLEEGRLDIGSSQSLGNPSRIEFHGDRTALSVSGNSTVVVNGPLIGNAGNLPDRTQIRIGASGGSTLVLNGSISGDTNVRFSTGGSGGGGLVVLNSRSSYAGHTTINNSANGIIRLGTDNALPTTTRLRFGDDDNQDPTGRFDLNGFNQTVASLEKNNLRGVAIGGIMNSSDQTSTITVNQSRNTYFDGPVAGNVNLIKQGRGSLVWEADSPDMQGTIGVQEGNLTFNGSAPQADVLVTGDGVFSGFNLIGSLTNSGTVTPGNSPGIISTVGNFTQGSSGRLIMDLEGTQVGQYDRLIVGGNSSLDGTMVLQLENFIPRSGDVFPDLVVTAGTSSGSFSRVESSPLVDYSVNTSGRSIGARVNSVNFASPRLGQLGPNQQQVANFLQKEYKKGIDGGDFPTPIATLMTTALAYNQPSSVRSVYQQFAADEVGALPVLAFQSSAATFSYLQGRIDGLRFGSAGTPARGMDWFRPENTPLWESNSEGIWRNGMLERPTGLEWSMYGSGNFRTSRQDATSTIDQFNSNTIGGAFGVDLKMSGGYAGLFGGYENTSTQFPLTNSQIDTDTAFFGAHLTWLLGDLSVTGALAYAYSAYSLERRIPVLGETATGKTDGNQFSALLSTSYDFKSHGWLISPTMNVQFSQLWVDGYSESGSVATQRISSFSVPSLQMGAGIRIAKVLPGASVTLIPEVRVGYRYEALANSRTVGTQFVEGGDSFGLVTQSVDRNAAVLGAGLTAVFNNGVTAFIDYNAEVGDSNQVVQTANAGFRIFLPGGPSLASSYELPDDRPNWLDSVMASPPANFLKQIGFHGRFQTQYANLRTNAEGRNVSNPGNFNELFIRRFYFGIEREIFSGMNADITLKYDEQEGELSLFKAVLEYQPVDWFGLRVGYDKVPFGWEETTSSRMLKTIERSPATRLITGLGGDSEIGGAKNHVAVFGEIEHKLGVGYYDFAIAYPSDEANGLFRNEAGNQLYYYGRMGNVFATPYGDFDLGVDLAYMPTDFRSRGGATAVAYAAHLQYTYMGFMLTAEFLAANYEDDPGDPIRNPMGFYLTPSYFITPQIELVGQFAWLDGQGAHNIRLNQVIPNAPTNYPDSRQYDNLYYWFVGFNYYLRGNTVKFQAGLQWSEASGVRSGSRRLTQSEQTFGARAQMQILW